MKREEKFVVIILGVFLLVLSGCGKKGPPFLPDRTMPPRVEQLTGEFGDGVAVFQGRIAALPKRSQEKDSSNIMACRVYHAWYSFEDPPCEGCPIDYPAYQEIKGDIRTEAGFSCEVPIEAKAGIHFFQIRLIGPDESIGPPSNRVKLTIDH